MASYTLDQIGSAPAADPSPAAPKSSYSLQEALGQAKPSGGVNAELPARKERSEASIVIGGIGAAAGAVSSELATFGDMFLNAPGGAVASVGWAAKKIGQIGNGKDGKLNAQEARGEFERLSQQYSPNVLTKFVKLFTPAGEVPAESNIEKGMNTLIEWSDRDMAEIERQTKGFLKKEDLQTMRDSVLNVLGAKGTAHVGGAGMARAAKPGTPKAVDPTAGGILSDLNKEAPEPPKDQGGQAKIPDDARINAQTIANKLMQQGRSNAVVERVIKSNPLVGEELQKTRDTRQHYNSAFGIQIGGEVYGADGKIIPKDRYQHPQYPMEFTDETPLMGPGRTGAAEAAGSSTPAGVREALRAEQAAEQRRGEQSKTGYVPGDQVEGFPRFKAAKDAAPVSEQHREGTLERRAESDAARASWMEDQQKGTEPHTDPHSHTRIEVPAEGTKAMPAGRRGQQFGAADPKMLVSLAAITGGALIASHLADQEKLEAALAGGMVGAAALFLPRYVGYVKSDWKGAMRDTATLAGITGGLALLHQDHPVEAALIGSLWGWAKLLPKAIVPKIGNMTIDELVNLRNGAIAAGERKISNVAWAIREAVPSSSRREAMSLAIDSGDLSRLSPQEQQAAKAFQSFTSSIGTAAKDVGVLRDLLENYVTHIVEKEGLPKSKIGEVMSDLFGEGGGQGGGASPTSPFARVRKYDTFADLSAALKDSGLKIKTMDLAEITEIYGHSMNRAIENKRLVNSLEAAQEKTIKSGEKTAAYIMDSAKAPPGYVTINSPQLRGKAVHPDLAGPLRFVMEGKSQGEISKAVGMLAMAQKRIAVGLSAFHANNLINAFVAAGGLEKGNPKAAIDAALKAYRSGGLGDPIDTLIKGGLRVERPMEMDQAALAKIGKVIDQGIEKVTGIKGGIAEWGLSAVEKAQKNTFDRLTWDYLHTGMKLATGLREFERLSLKHPELTKEQVAKQVASFTNDTFGGLDWYRVATESESQLGRKVGLAALSPKMRTALQVALFAPDWTMSTFRAMYKALPGKTDAPLTKALHQGYVARTALLYLTLMNGVNYLYSGHYIWQNDDPTKIDRGDGTTQQLAKHAMEGPEMILHPRQTIMNKLGFLIKLPIEIWTGREYLSDSGRARPIESNVKHALKTFSPIAITSATSSNIPPEEAVKRAIIGAAGFPIYRMSKDERAAAKEAEKNDPGVQRKKEEKKRKLAEKKALGAAQ